MKNRKRESEQSAPSTNMYVYTCICILIFKYKQINKTHHHALGLISIPQEPIGVLGLAPAGPVMLPTAVHVGTEHGRPVRQFGRTVAFGVVKALPMMHWEGAVDAIAERRLIGCGCGHEEHEAGVRQRSWLCHVSLRCCWRQLGSRSRSS